MKNTFRKGLTLLMVLCMLVPLFGLSVLAAIGCGIGISKKKFKPAIAIPLVMLIVGAIGVGGGILRDVMAGLTPSVFVKHFYACASLIGALLCALLWPFTGHVPAMLAGAVSVIVLRLLAAVFRWSLPRPD